MISSKTALAMPPYRQFRIVLYTISLLGCYMIWGLSIRNGTLTRMFGDRHAAHPILNGTNEPLKLHFTGIFPIDYFCTVMTTFFWEAVDGSRPDTSVVGLYFLPQALGILTPLWVEGIRTCNAGKHIAYANIWAFAMQSFSVGCVAPLYFATHLGSSPTLLNPKGHSRKVAKSLIARPIRILILQMAIILGYAIPGVLMVLPSPYISTSAQQQVAIVIWVLFPLWVSSFQTGFYALWINNWFQNQTSQSAAELASLNLRLLRYTYGSIFVLCAFAHVATVSFSTVAWLLPMLFAPRYVAAFHPSQLLFPANPSSVGSIGEGVLNFLQWDQWLGYSAALIWAVTLYHDAQAKEKRVRSWDVLLAKIVGLIAVAGPGSAVIAVIWARDEIVLGEEVTRGEEIKPDEIS